MKNLTLCLLIIFGGCAQKEKNDVKNYFDPKKQNEILAAIITHIFNAPPYTRMEDRFEAKHKAYYLSTTSKFEMVRYFIDKDSVHYFYVIRPSSIANEKRAVGGHFKLKSTIKLTDFKEEFVTTVMNVDQLKTKAAFLFDEMVKGDLDKYLGMKHYVQWPNEITYYDTTIYQWKVKPEISE